MTKLIWPVCITVDCDALDEHHAVWGLPAPSASVSERFWIEGVSAAAAFLQNHNVVATFFVVGSRVPVPQGKHLLQTIMAHHEIGNHTWSHPWDLSRLDALRVQEELVRNHVFLTDMGGKPRGFRAPGYHLSPTVVQTLLSLNYQYSSSQLTGFVYPVAKYAASLWMRLRKRKTRTIVHPISDVFTPRVPYRPHLLHPWRRGNAPLWEIPIAASTWGLPSVGPLIHAIPHEFLFFTPVDRPWILNFHLTDFIDERLFVDLARVDPMLRSPRTKRLQRITQLLAVATRQNREFCTLSQLCNRFT